MTFKEQRLAFAEILKAHYPPEEIHSFFLLLTEYYFGYNRFETHQKDAEQLPVEKERIFSEALIRLQEKEPIQYIIGETEFFSLPFKVTKDTLIPRPETEELVALVLSETATRKTTFNLLDIGTGSGCIAISIAKNSTNAIVSALDFSGNALEVAEDNAELNSVNVRFMKVDILKVQQLDEKYDVIVSNPPYVRDLEKELMQANVLDFEPASALFVRDDDPLVFYRKIAALALKSLNPNGQLFFEINEHLAAEMSKMLQDSGFQNIKVIQDIYGKDRIMSCGL